MVQIPQCQTMGILKLLAGLVAGVGHMLKTVDLQDEVIRQT